MLSVCPGCAAIPAAPPGTGGHGDDELWHALCAQAHTGVQSGGSTADLTSSEVFELVMFVLEQGRRLDLDLDGGVDGHGTFVVVAKTSSTGVREDGQDGRRGNVCVETSRCAVTTVACHQGRHTPVITAHET